MTFKIKPDNIHIISAFSSLGECLEFQKKTQTLLMETDSYSIFVGICIAGVVNDISVYSHHTRCEDQLSPGPVIQNYINLMTLKFGVSTECIEISRYVWNQKELKL